MELDSLCAGSRVVVAKDLEEKARKRRFRALLAKELVRDLQ
jgi:hypothetical protein